MTNNGYQIESSLVRQFGTIHLTGDTVPPEFFAAIKLPSGKPDIKAILILCNLIYWFRPIRPRDPNTDKPLAWRQKFKGIRLQRDYEFWESKFGFTKRECKEACARLKNGGWIGQQNEPNPHGGSKNYFQPNFEKIFSTLFPQSRLTFERQPGQSDRRSNVSRNTFQRQPSLLIHEINIKTNSSSNTVNLENAAAAAASLPVENKGSIHDLGTILAFVKQTRQTAKNPKGLANTLLKSGEDDELISGWLAKKRDEAIELAKRRDGLIVPDWFVGLYEALPVADKDQRLDQAIALYNEDAPLLGNQTISDDDDFSEAVRNALWCRIYFLHQLQEKAA